VASAKTSRSDDKERSLWKAADLLQVILFKVEEYSHRANTYLPQMSIDVVTQCLQRYQAGCCNGSQDVKIAGFF
jgi:hypothetical protein